MFVCDSLGFVILFGVSTLFVDGLLPGLFGGIIATGVGLAATISGVKGVNDWWRLSTTDSVPMDEAVGANELVQVQGHVRPSQPSNTIRSPIHDKECVAYEYKINHIVQGTGDPSIDSGSKSIPFIISDETAEILVDPTADSLSLQHERNTVTGGEEMLDQVDEEKLDVEPSVHTENSGVIKGPIELMEGTISIGEDITVVGKTNTPPESVSVAADAVMTSGVEDLTVMNDGPRTTTLKTGARGVFLLIIGLLLSITGLTAFVTTITGLV
ncbi:hypothetical protein [Halostagnicola kamekurae]|uniref:RING-type E3 ubiquitin transferase n=1 Tax=Halostagnicola kamekurae TaxID=619731 RepID=A0A1I6TTX5_9EURY|nr:hypothetical protein [Halostagnicola kamekurae]SFS92427.1 hypothetical protein SAMN04488556_3412 [Halostagnicola kamekurae]